ncbi:MAG: hypothetical protein FWD79_03875 [Desulfobulbus sp.]|nr:hypothetical protein [Desulfobulbus sp.]
MQPQYQLICGAQVLVTGWIGNDSGFFAGRSGFDLVGTIAHAGRSGPERKGAAGASLDLIGIIKSVTLEKSWTQGPRYSPQLHRIEDSSCPGTHRPTLAPSIFC